MTKEDLIKHCRYYKGEDENPFEPDGGENQNKMMFWFYEQCWVNFTLATIKDKNCEDASILHSSLKEYIAHGLADFEQFDNVPIKLKALLFNRYCHWIGYQVDDFKEWYDTAYFEKKPD